MGIGVDDGFNVCVRLGVNVGVPVFEGMDVTVAVGGVPVTLNSPRAFQFVPTKKTN